MQGRNNLQFADANSTYADSTFVLFGVPFDNTCSFRTGARFGPAAVRTASYNFETWLFAHGIDLAEEAIFDWGDVHDFAIVDQMVAEVEQVATPFAKDGKVPMVIGGEHSISAPWIGAYATRNKLACIQVDAHLDFRDSYQGLANSHACAAARIVDRIGVENHVVIGARSICREEHERATELGLRWYSAFDVRDRTLKAVVQEALDYLKPERVIVTLDIDGIDPAYAPGTGTPEPFGLTPMEVRQLLIEVGPRLVGFDVNEIAPVYDQGITAALAARMVREAMGIVARHRA